ncbi:MAG: DNA polymerase III subunit delta [Acidobacteriota bacterium]
MNFKEFQDSLQDPHPVYLLRTDQDYLKKKVFELCRSQVDEGARGFDWNVFEAPADSGAEIASAARTLPWLGKRRWVFVRNAHQGGEELAAYLKDPSSRTVLVLDAARSAKGWPSKLPRISMPQGASIKQWILGRVKKEGYQIDPRAADSLLELVGEDLLLLESELGKQFLYRMESKRITLDSVLEMTLQARQYDIFTLIEAIASEQACRALEILNRLFDSGSTAPAIISLLYWNFRRLRAAHEMLQARVPFYQVLRQLKIWSYKGKEGQVRRQSAQRLEGILILLRQADLLLKSTSADPRIHLERVIVDMCG